MKKTYLLGGGIAVLTAAVLVGCNGNDDNSTANAAPSTTQVTITPSLGKILNAKVILRNVSTNAEQSADLVNGKATFTNVPVGATVIAEVKPLADKITYFDEALKVNKDVTGADLSKFKLRVAIPEVSANQNVGVSALTEAAVNKIAAIPTKAAIQEANTSIASQVKAKFGATIDILQTPTLIGATTDYSKLANDQAGQYATFLALLAKTAQNLGQTVNPALAMLQSLSDDFKDGQLDGAAEGTTLAVNVNTPAFRAAKEQAVQAFKTSLPKLDGFFSDITFSGGVGIVGNYGKLTITSSTGGTTSTTATTASVITINNIKTYTWSDGSGSLILSQNAQTNQAISVTVSGEDEAASLICNNTNCANITINSTAKTVNFNNLSIPNINPTGQAISILGTLKTDIATQVTGGFNVATGGTVSAADLAKLAGSYTGTGVLTTVTGQTGTPTNTSCSGTISSSGNISVSGGGFSLTVQPNQSSVVTNTTVNNQTFKSIGLIEVSAGATGAGIATAVFDTAGKLFSVSGSKVSINLQNPTAATTTTLLCTFQ